MASARETMAAKCKIDTFEFWANTVSGNLRRSLVGHGGIGIEGQSFEDLGEDAEPIKITAEIFEDEFLTLKSIFRKGKKVAFTHPLFDVSQVRFESLDYNADSREMVDVTISVFEDGEREIALAPIVLSLGTEAARWHGAISDINITATQLTADGFDVSDFVDPLILAAGNAANEAFSAVVDAALEAEAAVDELAAAYSVAAKSADDTISELEEAGGVFGEIIDDIYGSIAIAQDVVRSVSVLDSAPWNLFRAQAPTLMGSIAADFLGADNEDNVALILEYNPTLIDMGLVPAGVELIIPVLSGTD